MTRIGKTSIEDMPIFGQATVGTSASQLCQHTRSIKGVIVKADESNADRVYVGTENSGTNNGLPLVAGASIHLEVENPSDGKRITLRVTPSGANRTLTLPAAFNFGSQITEITATVDGTRDYIGAIHNGSNWDVIAYAKGY